MKVAELRFLARVVRDTLWARLPATEAPRLAKAVLELLGAGSLCGREPFQVRDGRILIGDTNSLEVGGELGPDEARAIGVDLLRAADEAEG